jgi:uncharacterized RDD family membrane protein YckC
LGRQTGLTFLESPFPALLFGGIIVLVLYMVPVLGFLVWGITTPLGLGAVVCAGIGLLERREKIPPPPSPHNTANPIPPSPTMPLDVSAAPNVSDVNAYTRGGFWVRLAATILDLLLVGFVVLILGYHSPGAFFLIWTAYHIGMWAWRATTIGGIILGLKIVRLDGQPVTIAVALVRSLAGFLSALLFFVGFFWAGWDAERQSWHDKIAGTTIVRIPKGMPLILV